MDIPSDFNDLLVLAVSGVYLWAGFACFVGVGILWVVDYFNWPKWLAKERP